MQPQQPVDPTELFRFLETVDQYPTTGNDLEDQARQFGLSEAVAKALAGIPGPIESEAQIVEYMADANKPPRGTTIDTSSRSPVQAPTVEETLEVEDIMGSGA